MTQRGNVGFKPALARRQSIRLKDYDYSQPEFYFVTVCVQNRECLLGEVKKGKMRLNEAGQIVHTAWNQLIKRFSGIELDEFIVMPNHVHGIIAVGEDTEYSSIDVPPNVVGAIHELPPTSNPTNSTPEYVVTQNHEVF